MHLKCSGLQNAAQYRRTKNWACSSCNSPLAPPQPQASPPPLHQQLLSTMPISLSYNGTQTEYAGNNIVELGIFMEKHKVKVAVIQESKLSQTLSTPCIQNYTTVRKDRRLGQGGGLLTFIHKSINFSRKPEPPETLGDPHLEDLSISARLGNTDLIIANIYIPPTSSCTGGYQPSPDHLMMTTDTLLLGDFNAHHSSWHSSSTDTRGTNLENTINGILNWDTPTRLPSNATPSSPDVSLSQKIFERVMFTQLSSYFNINNLLSEQQYGFRSQHSMELACVKLADYIIKEMDNIKEIKIPAAIFLDLSKAFDTLNFDILLYKLKYYGVHGTSLALIKSYLNRYQYVQLENSELLEIVTVIPHGSIFDPLIFEHLY